MVMIYNGLKNACNQIRDLEAETRESVIEAFSKAAVSLGSAVKKLEPLSNQSSIAVSNTLVRPAVSATAAEPAPSSTRAPAEATAPR